MSEPVEQPAVKDNRDRSVLPSAILGGMIGAAIGLPLSYFFQAGLIRAILSLPQYVEVLVKAIVNGTGGRDQSGIMKTALISVLVMAVIGTIFGAWLSSRKRNIASQ